MSFATESQIRKPLDAQFLTSGLVTASRRQIPALSDSQKEIDHIAVFVPLFLLALLQVADAILTLKGISIFGSSAEGNPILRALIHATSASFALVSIKCGCIATLATLFMILKNNPISWVPGAIWGINAIYLFGAIIPWTYLLI